MKLCSNCKTEKPLTDFYVDRRLSDGHKHKCKACEKVIKQQWYKENRTVSIERSKAYRASHPEWAKEADARHHARYDWRKQFPEKAKALAVKQARARRFRKYGITQAQYDSLLASQLWVCAACKESPVTSSVRSGANKYDDFVVDHCHVTGKIRGIVCTNCNVALGMIRDNPATARKLAIYLETVESVSQGLPLNSGLEVQSNDSYSLVAEQLNF